MNAKAVILILVFSAIVCAITSYFMYKVFEPWGVGWVGIGLSVVFILFIAGMILRAMVFRRT
jgi:hypothetical protein